MKKNSDAYKMIAGNLSNKNNVKWQGGRNNGVQLGTKAAHTLFDWYNNR